MPIYHKFLQQNWDNGFQTHNAILDVTPGYKPEVLIVGTFNHGWAWNPAEFFYGRNYFWPIFGNLANNNPDLFNGNSFPPIGDIWSYCESFKMTFADVVNGTNQLTTTAINTENKYVTVTNPNLPIPFRWKNYSDKQLNQLGSSGCLDNNIQAIINYINASHSIAHIYFTWKLDGSWLSGLARQIINSEYNRSISFANVLSPSGNGFGKNLAGYPTKLKSIQHTWSWVNNPMAKVVYNRHGFSHFNHPWLERSGVNLNLF